MIKGHDPAYSATQAAARATNAAAMFTTARIFQSRSGQHCAICKDTPEMRRTRRNDHAWPFPRERMLSRPPSGRQLAWTTAGREQVAAGAISLGAYLQQAQHRGEQVVVACGLRRFPAQAGQVQS